MGPKSKTASSSKSKVEMEDNKNNTEKEMDDQVQDSNPKSSNSSKRKVKDEPESEDTVAEKTKVKTKKVKGPTVPIHSDLPTNRTFPNKLEFTAKPESFIRISAWNVCGVIACDKKGLKTYLQAEDPDIMIMSETKTQAEPDLMHLKLQFKYRYWGADPQKGYAGVAILSKHKPLNVVYGLPTSDDQESTRGRMITLEFTSFYLIGTYTPNAGDNLKFMARKNEWNVAFERYLRELDAVKPVVWGGDINCALTEKDLRNAATSWNKIAGYTKDECEALDRQLNPDEGSGHGKLVDAWRVTRPDLEGHYTYVSERILKHVKVCEIRQECYGASDHVPVILEIEMKL
ncbi:hypothetical protein CROQUDRAFT_654176 [Cronartium quercuum f. sp. fusiforme G11]|uniref:Endonuclease/exonuclease/phosphatase domain-containing protein n=1 Tax=Cronartium quercuum f. sp. fusiforme G11 TaxID=708437 RepID=A0A9P6TEP9_9BASI|nr:hypothetical protein CROQUDRAFT_654176 [Cronartium quercuum f. sp. fusiforme G11]